MEALKAALPFVLILAVFWLLIIRPSQRRQRALHDMRTSLQVGDDVMLASGIFGTLTRLDDERAEIEVAPGVRLTVAVGAIASRETAPEPTASPAPPAEDEA